MYGGRGSAGKRPKRVSYKSGRCIVGSLWEIRAKERVGKKKKKKKVPPPAVPTTVTISLIKMKHFFVYTSIIFFARLQYTHAGPAESGAPVYRFV